MMTGRFTGDETAVERGGGAGFDFGRARFWPAAVPHAIKMVKMMIEAVLTLLIDE